MKIRKGLVGLALIAPLSSAWGAEPVDPESLTKVPCSDLHYSKAFLEKYPQAPNACIEGRQDKAGNRYAKFNGKVYLNSTDRTTLQLQDASGDTKTTFSFKPKPGTTIKVGGKKVRFADLHPGDTFSFWVPESRLTAGSLPEPTAQSWKVLPPLGPQK